MVCADIKNGTENKDWKCSCFPDPPSRKQLSMRVSADRGSPPLPTYTYKLFLTSGSRIPKSNTLLRPCFMTATRTILSVFSRVDLHGSACMFTQKE